MLDFLKFKRSPDRKKGAQGPPVFSTDYRKLRLSGDSVSAAIAFPVTYFALTSSRFSASRAAARESTTLPLARMMSNDLRELIAA